jgi:hypothetical protein
MSECSVVELNLCDCVGDEEDAVPLLSSGGGDGEDRW